MNPLKSLAQPVPLTRGEALARAEEINAKKLVLNAQLKDVKQFQTPKSTAEIKKHYGQGKGKSKTQTESSQVHAKEEEKVGSDGI